MSHGMKTKLTFSILGSMVFGVVTGQGFACAESVIKDNQPSAIDTYEMSEQTVEAKRPDWEDKLSPGTVTVIRPDDYKGEQKELPDLLKMVPGVHVREVNGKGQYTTVTVRGSTAAQVGIFVDGVLTNLGGDSAVDLSTIPVKNVERIEVYRGYIPSRFGGTFMGGVVNIVTKKPTTAHTTAEIGKSSYGGKQFSAELTSPAGAGSLMIGANYESSDGDFPYTERAVSRAAAIYRTDIENDLAGSQAILDGITTSAIEKDAARSDIVKDRAKLAALQNTQRYRKYNDYSKENLLVKWQSPDWMVKASYDRTDRHLPDSVWGDANPPNAFANFGVDVLNSNYLDARHQKIDNEELLLQHRNTTGKLEWGWMLDYLHSDKKYDVGIIGADYTSNVFNGSIPLRLWSKYLSNKLNGQVDGTYKINDHQMLDFQMNYSHERMTIDGSNIHDAIANTMVYRQMRNKYDQNIFNFQVQDTITLGNDSSWFLTPSLRYNRSEIVGYSDNEATKGGRNWIHKEDSQTDAKGTWQLALKKVFNEHFLIRMTGGTYYRLLNMYEIAGDGAGIMPMPTDAEGQSAAFPRPEDGKQFDLSAVWDGTMMHAENKSTLTYFWRDANNMLQLRRKGKDYFVYYNNIYGKVHGAELQSNFKWNKVELNLSGTYTHSDLTDTIDKCSVWATYQPEWEGNVRLTYSPTTKVAFFGEMHYTDEYHTMGDRVAGNASESEKLGRANSSLTVFNAGIKWQPKDAWLITLGCNDIFDRGPEQTVYLREGVTGRDYNINADYPLQGRTWYATLKYEF